MKNWTGCEFNGYQTSQEIAEMLYIEIKNLKEIEENKFLLSKCKGFSILDLYDYIEKTDTIIDLSNLSNFLQKFNYCYDLKLLSKAITRISRSKTNSISYFQFADYFLCNQAYFLLGDSYPSPESSPLELNYHIIKNYTKRIGERSEIFYRTYEKYTKTKEDKKHFIKLQKNSAEIEALKRILALKSEFNLKELYKFFAGNHKKISQKNFAKALEKINILKNNEEILEFYANFCRNEQKLSFQSFFRIFASESEEFKDLLFNHTKVQSQLSFEALKIVSKLLNLLIPDFEIKN